MRSRRCPGPCSSGHECSKGNKNGCRLGAAGSRNGVLSDAIRDSADRDGCGPVGGFLLVTFLCGLTSAVWLIGELAKRTPGAVDVISVLLCGEGLLMNRTSAGQSASRDLPAEERWSLMACTARPKCHLAGLRKRGPDDGMLKFDT